MNEQIKEYLEYYIALPESPQFAVLISGGWGSGKSFFVRKFTTDHPQSKYLYVSLYGVTSTKEISDQIFEQLHPLLASKGAKIFRKVGAAFLKGAFKMDLTHDSHLGLNTDFSKIELPEFLKNADDRILIFDDLERCAMDIVNVLGYINQFVETNGNKVIIIANEGEIEGAVVSHDQPSEDDDRKKKLTNKYLRTKEKLIGKTFFLETDVEQAASEFFESVIDRQFKDYISSNREAIINTYAEADYNNLRHLKQAILDLDRFFKILPDKAYEKPELINDLVRTFVALSFELKIGRHIDEINKIYVGAIFDEPKDGTLLKTLKDKYGILKVPINVTFWYEFLSKGTFKDKDEVASWISNSQYFLEENTPPEIKLWRWWDLDDASFAIIRDKVVKILTAGNINNQYLLSHIVSILMSLSIEQLCDLKKDEILKFAKENVDRLKDDNRLVLEVHDDISFGAYNGLGYNARELPEFISYYEYLKKAAKSTLPMTYETQGKELLKNLESAPKIFVEEIIIGNTAHNKYFDKPVLASIVPSDFVEKYIQLSNVHKGVITYGLSKRYVHLEFMRELVPELKWLEEVKSLLQKELDNPGLTVSKKLISSAVKKIEQAMINLNGAIAAAI